MKENLASKRCTQCLNDKSLDMFYNHKGSKDGKTEKCAECSRRNKRDYYNKNKENVLKRNNVYRQNNMIDDFYSVYYLPEEHYIGITNQPKLRFQQHRRAGKIINGYEIIGIYDNIFDAMITEIEFHRRGYFGFTHSRLLPDDFYKG